MLLLVVVMDGDAAAGVMIGIEDIDDHC